MKINDNLKNIIINKGVDNFCDSIEYLKKAGYSETDSFLLSLEYFPPEIENILGIIKYDPPYSTFSKKSGYIIFFKNNEVLLDEYLKFSIKNGKSILMDDIKNYKTIFLTFDSFMCFFQEKYNIKINHSSDIIYQQLLFPEELDFNNWITIQSAPTHPGENLNDANLPF